MIAGNLGEESSELLQSNLVVEGGENGVFLRVSNVQQCEYGVQHDDRVLPVDERLRINHTQDTVFVVLGNAVVNFEERLEVLGT